ncbi:MAG TPA: dihydrolipoyllysine-residue acetyltransferase [Casimicrobiaceae bacterium]|nr:dihydrolipoyllysine-residue acetyltransferase [Casimicrobiaceae bacterium]
MSTIEVKVPDIGDFKDVPIIEVFVKPGDSVEAEDSLITLESDKATMDVPAPAAGTVSDLRVKLGDKVSEGTVILALETGEAGASKPAAAPSPSAPAQQTKERAPSSPSAPPHPPLRKETPPTPARAPGPRSSAAGGPALTVVRVPDIGDFKDVPVIEVFVKPGDEVEAEDALVTLESDKATMDVPAPSAGMVRELKVKLGDKVSEGSELLTLETAQPAAQARPATATSAEAPQPARAAEAPSARAATSPPRPPEPRPAPSAPPPAPRVDAEQFKAAHASPSVRKFARELGVDLAQVTGTGPKERIRHEDVQSYVKQVLSGAAPAGPAAPAGALPGLAPWPQVDFAKFGEIEKKPLSRIKKISGANLHRNWVMIPHVTNCEDADITELEAFRVQLNRENEKSGVKLTLLAFLIKACVAALKKFPDFNASLDGDSLVYKKYFHIGFAADTPNGLVVPVVKNADQKGVLAIASETSELAAKAREGKLAPIDMQGGCFSISSLGGLGGTYFTPIINAPEVAILGVCRSSTRPVWDGKAFAPRLILPLSLSYDHRVIDGAAAARFNTFLAGLLGDMRRAVL